MAAAIPAVIGGIISLKGQSDAKKAANAANAAAQQAQVNIPQVAQMATNQALQNLALSQQAELQYAPENALLRRGSILGLIAQMGQNPNSEIQDSLMAQFQGGTNTYGGDAGSALLSDAIARAKSDLALGTSLPQEVRNLVARTAAGRSGAVSGGLGLGRDITARDLGTTGLALAQQRLNNAQSLGQAELGANQFNSSQLQQANQFGVGNNLNLASLMAQLNGQDFSRILASAQFGQGLQAPTVGLDPSAIANLAVGNSNSASQAGINAAGIRAQSANNLTNFGGQMFGYGFGNLGDVFKSNNFQSGGYNNPTLASRNGANGSGIGSYYGF